MLKKFFRKLIITISFTKPYDMLLFVISTSFILAIFSTLLLYTVHGNRLFLLGTDFRAFYTGGQMILNGVSRDFYTLSTQYNWQHSFVPEMSHQSQLMPFIYPPFVAVPMALIAHFPFEVAYIVYMLWNIALLVTLYFLSMRILKQAETKIKVIIVAMTIAFLPILFAVMQGQLSLLLAIALLNAWFSLRLGKNIHSGLWLSLLLVRPYLIVVPLFVFILKRQIKVLVGLTIGSTALFLISFLLVGWTGLQNYINLLVSAFNWGDAYTRHPQMMHSWNGFLSLMFNTNHLSGISLILWLLGIIFAIGLLLWTWRKHLMPQTDNFSLQWAILVLVMLFTSVHVNFHDLSVLIVPGILVILYITKRKQDVKWNTILSLLLILGYFFISITLITEAFLRLQVSVLFIIVALVVLALRLRIKRCF